MIITITGKPCSGKGSVSKKFCEKYKFDYVCTGDMFREFAAQYGYDNILEFQQKENVEKIDKLVDDKTRELGEQKLNSNIVVDSRLAWHFIPKSYKVFIDVSLDTASKRLVEANRDSEQVDSVEQAKEVLTNRWIVENKRYQKLYNTDNLNPNNYDLVISSDNKTVEELADIIYENYKKNFK